jgi:hypothetical protein
MRVVLFMALLLMQVVVPDRDVGDSIMWISALQPPMEVTKIGQGDALVGLKVRPNVAFFFFLLLL